MRRGIFALVLALALVPYAGRWVAAFDSFAIVQPYLAALLVLLAVWASWPWRAALLCGAVLAAWPAARLVPAPEVAGGPALRLFQHNVNYLNDGRLLPDVLQGHDVATLQEVQSIYTALRTLPDPWVGFDCPDAPGIGTAVATRLPVLDHGCLKHAGHAWVRVQSEIGPVTVLSMHLPWPWPAGGTVQKRLVDYRAWQVSRLPKPVVIGGDFNQMPWSGVVNLLADGIDGAVAPGLRSTYEMMGGAVRLPIDHVLLPEGWLAEVETGPRHLSDHRSVTARIVVPLGAGAGGTDR